MMKNEKRLVLRHCGVPCCGTCKWYKGPCYESMVCNNPRNYVNGNDYDMILHVQHMFVCNFYEEREDNADCIKREMQEMSFGCSDDVEVDVFDDRIEIGEYRK